MTHLSNQIQNNDLKGFFSNVVLKDDYETPLKDRLKQDTLKAVNRWCQAHNVKEDSGCLFAVTITPKWDWLLTDYPTNGSRLDATISLAEKVLEKSNDWLWKNPKKNTHRFIQGTNVVEMRDHQTGAEVSHHIHALWCVHPVVASNFTTKLLERIKDRTPSLACIKDFDVQTIHNDPHDGDTWTSGWCDYIYKHASDRDDKHFAHKYGKWEMWDNGFTARQ